MKEIPRIHFAHLPTPIEFLPNLTTDSNGPRLFIKRDDQTGLALGGNKTRKLEFLVADAQAKGARCLITAGAVQSNHCRQTAAAAAKFGMECILVLTAADLKSKLSSEVLSENPDMTEHKKIAAPDGNLLLDQLFNAKIVWAKPDQRDSVLQEYFDKAEQQGKKPYLIPYGGSNQIGAIGYVYGMKELLEQLASNSSLPYPDWIVFPSSSGGTQAGLILGAKLFEYQGRVLGISVDETAPVLQERVLNIANRCAEYIDVNVEFSWNDILVDDHYLGGGYGVMGKNEQDAIRLFGRLEGIILDPVYTGRAAGGMMDLIRKRYFAQDKTVLFWHTGGTPALFAQKYQSALFSS